jgi:PAS domain S-box-containing protein
VERKRKLEQIVEERTESLRKLTRTVEQTGSSILVTDRDGTIEFVNPAFTTTTGYSNEEAIGQTPRLLRSGRTPAEVYEEMWSAILSGRTWQGELFNRKKDGTFYWEFATVSPIRDNEGRITHFVAIKEDITARKQAEAELVQARERAEAASQAKGAFLANMSHEIRTPMNGVIGMIGLLLDTPLTPVQRGFAETVRNSAESLLIIVNDILDFSRIEAGKLTLEEVEFDLRTALEDIAEFLAVRIQEKGLAFACVVDRDVPTWVSGDPMRLRQVLTNLIGNAIKFTKAGEIAVWVKKESNLPAGIAVRFDVEDTGIGIPQDRVSALFQPFTQADPSHSRIHGGSGLGLAISKRLVEVMGGEIDLESREGKGSRFSFTVHFGRALKGRGGPTDAGVNVAGLRVLIAETHPLHARALRSLMEPWGCLIGEAKTWEEVQNALLQANDEGKAYKAVFLDWKLPGFSDLVSIRRGLGERMQFVLLVPPNAIVEVSRVHIDTAQAFLSRPVKRGLLLRILERVQMGTALSVPIVFPEAGTAQTPKRRILVAEDNEVNRMVIQTTLERMGHAAEVVSNGVEALEALEQARYDLVLMDVQMPGMDGLEATRRIRGPESRVQYREVPIIALTAHAMKGNREECIQAGMDDYLSKPVHPVDLALAVERWAGGPSARTRKMAPSETVPSPLFNRDSLKNRLLGDADMQQEVLREFLEKSRLEIERFQHALLKADLEQLKNSGHRMTGTLGNIGSPRLSEFAAEIELAAGAGRLKEVYALAPRFLSEFENLKQEIERFQEESGH